MVRVDHEADVSAADMRRLTFIREETRFELGVMHDRMDTLISAEAFLTIAFTMAMGNTGAAHAGPVFKLLAPLLSLIGLTLAGLAWHRHQLQDRSRVEHAAAGTHAEQSCPGAIVVAASAAA